VREESASLRRAATSGARRADPATRAPSSSFDRFEILRHERTIDDEVVEEAFVGGRTDSALRAGKQVVTAAAIKCAVLWRKSASASGLSA
jgi:hypothetical protein